MKIFPEESSILLIVALVVAFSCALLAGYLVYDLEYVNNNQVDETTDPMLQISTSFEDEAVKVEVTEMNDADIVKVQNDENLYELEENGDSEILETGTGVYTVSFVNDDEEEIYQLINPDSPSFGSDNGGGGTNSDEGIIV